jgi:hypothetical protein
VHVLCAQQLVCCLACACMHACVLQLCFKGPAQHEDGLRHAPPCTLSGCCHWHCCLHAPAQFMGIVEEVGDGVTSIKRCGARGCNVRGQQTP